MFSTLPDGQVLAPCISAHKSAIMQFEVNLEALPVAVQAQSRPKACAQLCEKHHVHHDIANMLINATHGILTTLNSRLKYGNPMFRTEFVRALDIVSQELPLFRHCELWILYDIRVATGCVMDAIVFAPIALACTRSNYQDIMPIGANFETVRRTCAQENTHVFWTYRQSIERRVTDLHKKSRATPKATRRVRRGELCPCGTGMKFKHCCGRL